LLIDGMWHQEPPVRHKEILELLAGGVSVIGAASMGALRAAELAPYGMIGIGWVYQQYATGRIDADDEVAVTQTPEGKPLSTALVCLRYVLIRSTEAATVAEHHAGRLLGLARDMPYQQRSWRALEHAAASAGLTDPYRQVTAWRDQHGQADIKTADAEQALKLAAGGQIPQTAAAPWRDEPWRTSHLRSWAATFRPAAMASGAHVPLLAILHHAQLYDPNWPQRWRRHVLGWIASLDAHTATTMPSSALEDQALAAAHDRGLDLGSLTPGQIEHWATPTETAGLCPRELMLRIITRSARLDPTASVWPETGAEARELLDLDAGAKAAVKAWTTNQRVAATGAGRTTDRLDSDRVRAQLAGVWNVDPAGAETLAAAARDRGVLSIEEAVQMARPFYLAHREDQTAGLPSV
jgi:hypothetical protein